MRLTRLLLATGFLFLATPWSPATAANAAVDVENNAYDPDPVAIKVGDTVKWTWTGNNHSVTADDGSFDSECMPVCDNAGAEFEHTFNSVGEFDYYCRVHGDSMTGTVTVTNTPSPKPSPTAVSPTPTPTTASPTARPTTAPSTTMAPRPVVSSARPTPTPTPTPSETPSLTPTPTPTVTTSPSTIPSPTTASPSPSPTTPAPIAFTDPEPKDRTGVALVTGGLVAAAGLGVAGYLIYRGRAIG